jgi:hypothetical protein
LLRICGRSKSTKQDEFVWSTYPFQKKARIVFCLTRISQGIGRKESINFDFPPGGRVEQPWAPLWTNRLPNRQTIRRDLLPRQPLPARREWYSPGVVRCDLSAMRSPRSASLPWGVLGRPPCTWDWPAGVASGRLCGQTCGRILCSHTGVQRCACACGDDNQTFAKTCVHKTYMRISALRSRSHSRDPPRRTGGGGTLGWWWGGAEGGKRNGTCVRAHDPSCLDFHLARHWIAWDQIAVRDDGSERARWSAVTGEERGATD